MIYKDKYFSKEIRQNYLEKQMSFNHMVALGFFLGLFSFAIHFMLQTVFETVLTQQYPEIMLPSYFSVLYLYTMIANTFFVVYFMVNYRYLTFQEISENKWYLLTKFGFQPSRMILYKLCAVVLSILIIYTVGFLTGIGFTMFLKYPFVIGYMFSLYLCGLLNILLISSITMLGSILFEEIGNARYFVLGCVAILFVIKIDSGYYTVITDRILMQQIQHLFDFSNSYYMYFSIFIIIVCLFGSVTGAKRRSDYYYKKCGDIPFEGYEKQNQRKRMFSYRIVDAFMQVFFVVFTLGFILFHSIVLFVSISTPEKEISIKGVIPYVFQSSTMKPAIEKNDLAYFQKIDQQYPIEVGDIVLFKEEEKVYVERVIDVKGKKIDVDIENYPELTDRTSLRKSIKRDCIYGRYYGRNRWLGALILFSNTIFGRILFLILPSILIFFYQPIVGAIKKLKG